MRAHSLPVSVRTRRFEVRVGTDMQRTARMMSGRQEAVRRLFASDADVPLVIIRHFLDRAVLVAEICRLRDSQLAGVVAVTANDVRANHCFVSCISFRPEDTRHDLFFEGVIGAFRLVFEQLRVNRIRFDVLSTNLVQLRRPAAYCESEGIRRDWAFVGGRFVDAHLYSISLLEWNERLGELERRLDVVVTPARVLRSDDDQPDSASDIPTDGS